jgi:hypothetical protein
MKKAELQSALCCLQLTLPISFELRSLYVDDKDFVNGELDYLHTLDDPRVSTSEKRGLVTPDRYRCQTILERLDYLQPGQGDIHITDQAVAPTGTCIRSIWFTSCKHGSLSTYHQATRSCPAAS